MKLKFYEVVKKLDEAEEGVLGLRKVEWDKGIYLFKEDKKITLKIDKGLEPPYISGNMFELEEWETVEINNKKDFPSDLESLKEALSIFKGNSVKCNSTNCDDCPLGIKFNSLIPYCIMLRQMAIDLDKEYNI